MAMFEREIRFIYDFNLNRVKKLGSYLTFEQLVTADLHPAILQYISAEIDFLIFEDRQKLLKESVFDYSGKNIAVLFNQIDEEIKKTKKFSIEYINKILLHSTSFTINYLVRPRWTLSQFLFDNEQEKNSTEIKQILNYVYFYSYLKDTLVSYLDKKRLVSLSRSEFDVLIAKVDKLGVDTYLPTIIDTSIKSISEVFNIGSVQTDKFSLQAIELFLEEKELHTHLQKLNEVFPGDPRPKVSTIDLRNLLLDIEHLDLSFDPYMEEETIEEESIPDKESPEFEELEESFDLIENASDLLEDEFVEPELPIEEKADDAVEEVSEAIKPESVSADDFDQKMNNVIAGFENKDDEIVETIETNEEEVVISVSPEVVQETVTENFEEENTLNDELNEAVAEKYFDEINSEVDAEKFNEEESNVKEEISDLNEFLETNLDEDTAEEEEVVDDMEEEALEDLIDTVEEPAERKQKEIKSGDTTITINYPQGYEQEDNNNLEGKNSDEEVFEEEKSFINQEEISVDEVLESTIEEETTELSELVEPELEEEIESEVFYEEPEAHLEKENLKEEVEDIAESEQVEEVSDGITKLLDEEILKEGAEEQVEELIVDQALEETELVEDDTITEEVFEEETLIEHEEFSEEVEQDEIKETALEDDVVLKEVEEIQEEKVIEESELHVEDEEPELFPREEVEPDSGTAENFIEDDYYSPVSRIDITELLENKNMTKIIKTIFDYDMEDFANTIEQISECKSKEDADDILDKLYKANRVKPTSKEAGAFNEIIAEYFASEG